MKKKINIEMALIVLAFVNGRKVKIENKDGKKIVVTDEEPRNLTYPDGWYYVSGFYANEGGKERMRMYRSDGTAWSDYAKYCVG